MQHSPAVRKDAADDDRLTADPMPHQDGTAYQGRSNSLKCTETACEAVLTESDRRDRELRARLTVMRWAWRAGYARAAADLAAAWHAVADPASRSGPSYAEFERRRWGPGGREHFGDPRSGDYPGRDAA